MLSLVLLTCITSGKQCLKGRKTTDLLPLPPKTRGLTPQPQNCQTEQLSRLGWF